jgi:hypothetical protein
MCHASNTLWAVDEVDQGLVERPVAPGGATGGVEFEAMNYAVGATGSFRGTLLMADYSFQAAEQSLQVPSCRRYAKGVSAASRPHPVRHGPDSSGELAHPSLSRRVLAGR